tara:strand:+ start:1482 stop:1697 length:216 start_codon:yes stop_codon:yes gene_type:complete
MSEEKKVSMYDYLNTALEEGAMFADNGYLPACAFSAAASLKRIADYLEGIHEELNGGLSVFIENNEKDGQP